MQSTDRVSWLPADCWNDFGKGDKSRKPANHLPKKPFYLFLPTLSINLPNTRDRSPIAIPTIPTLSTFSLQLVLNKVNKVVCRRVTSWLRRFWQKNMVPLKDIIYIMLHLKYAYFPMNSLLPHCHTANATNWQYGLYIVILTFFFSL